MYLKKIIRINQHVFTKGKKVCLTNLINLYDGMTVLVDEETPVDTSACLDFRKAFDTVFPKILIDMLLMCRLDEQTVMWIEIWLNGWAQTMGISSLKLSWRPVISNIP